MRAVCLGDEARVSLRQQLLSAARPKNYRYACLHSTHPPAFRHAEEP